MTTKDYVYLGLILLTALAFYCNGFYAGVYRCKRMYDTLLDDSEGDEAAGHMPLKIGNSLAKEDKLLSASDSLRPSKLLMQDREVRLVEHLMLLAGPNSASMRTPVLRVRVATSSSFRAPIADSHCRWS